jgi:hypothetical protein
MPITVKRRLALQRATLCGDSLISFPQPSHWSLVAASELSVGNGQM